MPLVDRPTRVRVRIRLVWCLAAVLPVGVVAGFVWWWLADPAEWQVRSNGIVLTEAASRGQFAVIVVFVLVGAVASFGWAWVAGRQLAELGWVTAAVVVAATFLAAVVAWRLGVELGPPDPRTVSDAAVGDRLPASLAVDGLAPFLAWPIFGLVGLLGATLWGVVDDETTRPESGWSSSDGP